MKFCFYKSLGRYYSNIGISEAINLALKYVSNRFEYRIVVFYDFFAIPPIIFFSKLVNG